MSLSRKSMHAGLMVNPVGRSGYSPMGWSSSSLISVLVGRCRPCCVGCRSEGSIACLVVAVRFSQAKFFGHLLEPHVIDGLFFLFWCGGAAVIVRGCYEVCVSIDVVFAVEDSDHGSACGTDDVDQFVVLVSLVWDGPISANTMKGHASKGFPPHFLTMSAKIGVLAHHESCREK